MQPCHDIFYIKDIVNLINESQSAILEAQSQRKIEISNAEVNAKMVEEGFPVVV